MYTVFHKGTILYVGKQSDIAADLTANHDGAFLLKVENVDQLAEEFDWHLMNLRAEDIREQTKDVVESKSYQDLIGQLEETFGMDSDLAKKIRASGERVVAEVQKQGAQGMKAVGEGFIALGDLLRKTANPEKDSK